MRKPARGKPRGRIGSSLLLIAVLVVVAACVVIDSELQAAFCHSLTASYCGLPLEFDASGCYSANDTISSYTWRFGGGSTAQGRVVEHEFSAEGRYSVSLTITTSQGKLASASREVLVKYGLVVPVEYSTIQAAIDAAEEGETVLVTPGTYEENIRIREKRITVQSQDPNSQNSVKSTIIRGAEQGRPTVSIGRGSEPTLAGFTLLAGPVVYPLCGVCSGIVYIREASPTIRNNRIVNAPDTGIVIHESDARIEDNIVSNNTAGAFGGAIVVDCYRTAPRIVRNTFEGNSATSGGAIFITSTAVVEPTAACAAMTIVTGNTFRNNVATQFGGGAIFVEYTGNLRLDVPDSNTYQGNEPDNVFYVVPPE